MCKIAIAAGGTGGHIFPGIAIAEALQQLDPRVEILFIGSRDGRETSIVPQHDLLFQPIDIHKLYRFFTWKNLLFPTYLFRGIHQAYNLLKQKQIHAFVGCGGFVSGAVGIAAWLAKLPIFLQEQNSYPGLSTRWLLKKATAIYLGNPGAIQHMSEVKDRVQITGNPIRNFPSITQECGLKYWKLEQKKTIFIYGGSQGAHAINAAVSNIIPRLLKENVQVLWQTGMQDYASIQKKFGAKKNFIIQSFFNDMAYAYAAADVVICRAGALSLAEIALFEVPNIIIPFPYSAGQHQLKNAQSFAERGAGVLVPESSLSAKKLEQEIFSLLDAPDHNAAMKEALSELCFERSATVIAQSILSNIKEKLC